MLLRSVRALPSSLRTTLAPNRPLLPSLPPRQMAAPLSTSSAARALSTAEREQRNAQQREAISRDFRTDTITVPTDEMFELMRTASRGDDVYHEDPDTIELQERVAKMAGKEAALFCVSGTMTNQLAVRTHLSQPPFSVVLDSRAHIHTSEAGGVAFHSQATAYTVQARENENGGHHMTAQDVMERVVVGEDVHGAPTRLVCVENTLSGMVFPQSELVAIAAALKPLGIPLHCDGARLWEVLAKMGMSLEEACAPFETVSLCMSKGLGAPVGSILVGPKSFIRKAIHFRKLFGGGIRQSGSLALAASYCLDTTLPLLSSTHALSTRLAVALASPEIGIALDLPTETNMLWLNTTPAGFSMADLAKRAWEEKGIRIGEGWGRLVVHFQVSDEAVDGLIEVARGLAVEEGSRARREEWEKEEGREEVERVRRRSERFARGEWEGEQVEAGKKLRGYGKK